MNATHQYIIETRRARVPHAVTSGMRYVVHYPDGESSSPTAFGLLYEAENHVKRHAKNKGYLNFQINGVDA